MSAVPTHRVEFHQPRRISHLGKLPHSKPNVRTLDPFFSRLVREGYRGWLVLVDDRTGAVVAKRRLAPTTARGPLSALLRGSLFSTRSAATAVIARAEEHEEPIIAQGDRLVGGHAAGAALDHQPIWLPDR